MALDGGEAQRTEHHYDWRQSQAILNATRAELKTVTFDFNSQETHEFGPEEEHGIDPISYIFEGKTYRFEAGSSEGLYTLSIVDAEGNGSEWKDRTLQSLSEKLGTEEMKDITYKHDDLSYVVTVMKTETGDLTLLPPYDAEIIAEEDGTEETGPVATEAEPEPTAEETGDDSERGIEHLEPKINVIDRDVYPGEFGNTYTTNRDILRNRLTIKDVKDNKIYFMLYQPSSQQTVKYGPLPLSHFSTNPDRPSYITIAGVSVKTWIESDQIHAEILPYNSLGIEEPMYVSANISHLDCYIDNEGRDNTAHLQDFYTTGNLRIRIDDPTGAQPSYNKVINLKKLKGEKESLPYELQYYGAIGEYQVHEEKVGDVVYTWFIEKNDGAITMVVRAKEQKQAPTPGPVDAEFARAEKMTKGIDVDGGGEAYHVRAFDKDVKVGAQITDPDNQAAIREMSVARVGGWGDDKADGQLKLVSWSSNDQLFMDMTKAVHLGGNRWKLDKDHGLTAGSQDPDLREIEMTLSDVKKTPYGRAIGRIATFTVVSCPGDYKTTREKVKDKVAGVELPKIPDIFGDPEDGEGANSEISTNEIPGGMETSEGMVMEYDESVYDLDGNKYNGLFMDYDQDSKEFKVYEDGTMLFIGTIGDIYDAIKNGKKIPKRNPITGNLELLEIGPEEVLAGRGEKAGYGGNRTFYVEVIPSDGKNILRFAVRSDKYTGEALSELAEVPMLGRPLPQDPSKYDIEAGINSYFGSPRPGGRIHAGVDLTLDTAGKIKGEKVNPCLEGIVVEMSDNYGAVGIYHPEKRLVTRYVHLDPSSYRHLKIGQKVSTTDNIGKVDKTGSSDYHLHLEVRVANASMLKQFELLNAGKIPQINGLRHSTPVQPARFFPNDIKGSKRTQPQLAKIKSLLGVKSGVVGGGAANVPNLPDVVASDANEYVTKYNEVLEKLGYPKLKMFDNYVRTGSSSRDERKYMSLLEENCMTLAKIYKIPPSLIAACCATESGRSSSGKSQNQHNYFGIGVYDGRTGNQFSCMEESFVAFCEWFKEKRPYLYDKPFDGKERAREMQGWADRNEAPVYWAEANGYQVRAEIIDDYIGGWDAKVASSVVIAPTPPPGPEPLPTPDKVDRTEGGEAIELTQAETDLPALNLTGSDPLKLYAKAYMSTPKVKTKGSSSYTPDTNFKVSVSNNGVLSIVNNTEGKNIKIPMNTWKIEKNVNSNGTFLNAIRYDASGANQVSVKIAGKDYIIIATIKQKTAKYGVLSVALKEI